MGGIDTEGIEMKLRYRTNGKILERTSDGEEWVEIATAPTEEMASQMAETLNQARLVLFGENNSPSEMIGNCSNADMYFNNSIS
jgi:hypothetical protein